MALDELVALGVARELTGRKRDRLDVFGPYIAVPEEGDKPLGERSQLSAR